MRPLEHLGIVAIEKGAFESLSTMVANNWVLKTSNLTPDSNDCSKSSDGTMLNL